MFPKEVASYTEAAYPALAEAYVVLLTPFLQGQFASQRRVILLLQIMSVTLASISKHCQLLHK